MFSGSNDISVPMAKMALWGIIMSIITNWFELLFYNLGYDG